MRGLIVKDIIVYKGTLKKSIVFFEAALFLALLFFNHYIGLFLFNFVIMLTAGMSVSGIMFHDDYVSKWEKFMMVLPVSKKGIVLSRFVSVWIILGMEFVEILLFDVLSAVIFSPQMLMAYIALAVAGVCGAFILSAVSLAINYLKDDRMSGIAGIMTIIAVIIISVLIYRSGINIIDILDTSKSFILLIMPAGAVISFLAAFHISVWGFSRKHS